LNASGVTAFPDASFVLNRGGRCLVLLTRAILLAIFHGEQSVSVGAIAMIVRGVIIDHDEGASGVELAISRKSENPENVKCKMETEPGRRGDTISLGN
jgi:hypothetical protein